MKSLVTFIKESIITNVYEDAFNTAAWSHRGKYDYPRMVINSILNGEYLILGKKGEGVNDTQFLNADDFDKKSLQDILDNIDKYSDAEMIKKFNDAYHGNFNKNIWTNIYKSPFSGKIKKIGGGLEFEEILTLNIQQLIIYGKLPDNTVYKEVSENLWNKIKTLPTIKKLISKNLDAETIKRYVFVSGKGKTARNSLGQILNNDTFEVNVSKKNKLTGETEDEIENVLTQSGKIIADVTITLDGENFDKSDIKHVNPNDIYISCKDGDAQLSGICMQQPFYGNSPKTQNKSYLIECYRNNKAYDDFISEKNEICVVAFKNVCNLLGVDEKIVYDYFAQPVKERKSTQITTNKKPNENDEVFATLIQLLVGGNYWYANTSGEAVFIDDNIDENKFTFIPSGTGHLDPRQIVVSGKMKSDEGETKCELKFRNSVGGDYPFRLMVVPTDKHIISKLFT